METNRSDNPYFVSTEALIESENRDEMLQLVQMLVGTIPTNTVKPRSTGVNKKSRWERCRR